MRKKTMASSGYNTLLALACAGCLGQAPMLGSATATQAKPPDVVMQAMQKELTRSFTRLKNAGSTPVHYLAYRLYDQQLMGASASYGAIDEAPVFEHRRELNVELRVGSAALDNTHHSQPWMRSMSSTTVPIEDDEVAIRTALWSETDEAFKEAQKTFKEAQTNKDVMAPDEDLSNDFSKEKPQQYFAPAEKLTLEPKKWSAMVQEASAIYKQYPKIRESSVSLHARKTRRYLVNSEGTKVEEESIQYSVFSLASATADDGMNVWLYDHVEGPSVKDLPTQEKLNAMVQQLAKSVEQLRQAHAAEPFAGPVILRPKAAGVFFHEVFGHRAEGHRQKNEDEGKTFTKMVGRKIMPSFISVIDNPTLRSLNGKYLNGFYRFDDEGVPASKVVLVDHGVLKTFLLGRSPIKGFAQSNGHGRSSPGSDPVARQGNLIVHSDKTVSEAQLRQMLIAEIKRQKKPYGLIFDELAGGFTMTQVWMPQVFKLLPLRVYKVFADGRPDQLLRGVSIIGTPLVSLETIAAGADDTDTFNGNCGAESGWVPVSASSPSLLLRTLEIERQRNDQSKPPILPPPPMGK